MPKKSNAITYSESAITELEELASNVSNPRLAKRAAMVLECVKGTTGKEVAQMFGEREATVSKWKKRFQNYGASGLANLPRGYNGGMYGPPFQERLQKTILEPPPNGKPYWTAKLLSETLEVPVYVVLRYLRRSNIRLLEYRRIAKGETPPADNAKESHHIPDEDEHIPGEDEHIPGEDGHIHDEDEYIHDVGESTKGGTNTVTTTLRKQVSVSITAYGQMNDAVEQTIDVQMYVRLMEGSNCICESYFSLPETLPNLGNYDVELNDTS